MKKTIAILLTATLLFCAAPLAGFTAIDWPDIRLNELFALSSRAADIVASGNCGVVDEENGLDGSEVTWALDSDGVLTISGTGAIDDYYGIYGDYDHRKSSPWGGRDDLTKAVIENGITHIGTRAFYNCLAMTEIVIPDSVTSIGDFAFEDCIVLNEISLPEGVTFIGEDAIRNTGWYNAQPDGFLYLGKWLIEYKGEPEGLLDLNIKPGTVGVSHGVWETCFYMSINIPDSVKYLDHYFWFANTINVDPANPWFMSDENGALFDKDQTTLIRFPILYPKENYTIPESVTKIEWSAFADCVNLKHCVLPSNLIEIDDYAFYWSGITSLSIPSKTERIGLSEGIGCGKLTTINVAEDNPFYRSVDGVLFTKDMKTLLVYPTARKGQRYEIPYGTERIFSMAFYAHDAYVTLSTQNEIGIEYEVFRPETELETVIFPDSVTTIEGLAFFGRNNLKNVVLSEGLNAIDYCAFQECDALASVVIPASVTLFYDNTADDFAKFSDYDGNDPDLYWWDLFPTETAIIGVPGSLAQIYAEKTNHVFIPNGSLFLIMNAASTVSEPTVNIYGHATPGAKVVCSVNGAAIKTVTAAASGKWSAALPLAGAQDGDVFTVKAAVTVDGETAEQTAQVTYRPDAILFDKLTLTHGYYTETATAADPGRSRRAFTYSPDKPFSFAVTVTNSDKIDRLYVVSAKDGDARRMELTYDGVSGNWFATGAFDDDGNYVPGALTVEGVDKNGVAFDTGAEIHFTFLIDPSGCAYEAVQENVLEDVTARVFYKDAEGHEVLWNAEAYDQLNPQRTLADGAFAWVVPEGTWQVRLSKDGYEDAASEWMDVPPEHTNVYISMVSCQAPQVSDVAVYTDTAVITFSQYMEIASVNSETVSFAGYTGTLTPLDSAETAPGSGVYFAKTFLFASESAFARSVDVTVSGVVNYAGNEMEQPYTAHINSGLAPANLKTAANVTVGYGETAEITVTAQYAAGKTVTARIDSANVSLSAKTLTLDENGKATLTVTGLMPGGVTLMFALEGTALTATSTVTVSASETLTEPEDPTGPDDPTDPDDPTEPVTEPTTAPDDEPTGEECQYCHTVHPNTFMGRITKFIHSVVYFFAHLFGKM